MNMFSKIFAPVIFAAVLMLGAPYIKTTGSCGLTLPLAFTGAILGCTGEKEATQKIDMSNNSDAITAENRTAPGERTGGFKVTFVELGSLNCIPCKMMKPVMEEIEKRYQGQVKVIFHDVWTEQGKTEGDRFGIRAIPTQVFLDKYGKEYYRHEGFFPFEEVDEILKQQGVK